MSMLDPKERSALGTKLQAELTGAAERNAETLLEHSWQDFIYGEIWSRPGLDRRARFLVSLTGAACAGDARAANAYARGAVITKCLTLAELREAALHAAVYCGWSAGSLIDTEATKVASELQLTSETAAALCTAPWDPNERSARGAAEFETVMKFGGPPPMTPYFEAGIRNFVFGEMWHREGLDQRSRRWITLVGVGMSSAVIPIGSHVWSAMASGNASKDEMLEFVLQYAVHAGWPKGSVMQAAVLEQSKKVEAGLSYDG
jgi:4-carboxymuconolactone decarboxylase